MVGRTLLADAVALNSVQFNTARMLGGAVGGLAIAAWGIDGALFLNAASFLPIIAILASIHPAYADDHPTASGRSVYGDLRGGLSYALRTASVRQVLALFAVIGLLGFNWQVAVPLLARFVLHRSATGFGDLMAAIGAGSLVGAIVLARDRRATETRLAIGGVALGLVLVALGLTHSYPISLALLGLGGVAGIVTSITANTRLQLLTPDRLRGRVMGIYVLLMGGTTPIGAFVLGELAGHLGTGVALIIFGATTAGAVTALGLRPTPGTVDQPVG